MPKEPALITEAHRLLAGQFFGVLATHSLAHPGYPMGSLAPYCLDNTGAPLFLLSHLAAHTRNLDANPKMSLTVAAETPDDVLQRARLSLIGDAEQVSKSDAEAISRYFRYFPNGEPYYRDLNFRFYRLRPVHAHWVGGFGAARWIAPDRLCPPSGFDGLQEAKLLHTFDRIRSSDECHAALIRLGVSDGPGTARAGVAVGMDRHGIDLRSGERLERLHFEMPLANFAAALHALTGA